jgi:ribosomal protein S1
MVKSYLIQPKFLILGEEIEVKILSFDKEKLRVSLGIKTDSK